MVKSDQVGFYESSIIHYFGNAIHYGKKNKYETSCSIMHSKHDVIVQV